MTHLQTRGSEQFCPYNECYLPFPSLSGLSLGSDPNAILTADPSLHLHSSASIQLVLPMEHSVFQSASLRTPAVNSTLKPSLSHRKLLNRPAATAPSCLLPNLALHLQPRWPRGCSRNALTKSWRRTSIQVCLVFSVITVSICDLRHVIFEFLLL